MTKRLERTLQDRASRKRRLRHASRRHTRASEPASAKAAALRRFLPPMSQRVAHRLPNSAVRRLASEDAFEVSEAFERDLRAQRGKGHPLDATVAQRMGHTLGQDVSDVRVHTDEAADRMATSIQARAFAHGKELFFSHGAYDPQSESGQYTLAHELAHATDAHDTPASASSGRTVVGAANDPAEARAENTAQSAVSALRRQEMPEKEEAMALRRQMDPEQEEEEPEVQMLRRQEEEELQALRRQEMPEEEELQALRRQEMPEEEEELQMLRRQEMPEEEEVQTLRRQEAEEEEEELLQPVRRQEEEELEPIRRRVTVDVLSQTATGGAIMAMTTVELRDQITSLELLPELSEPQRENLAMLQAELARREGELEAATTEDLDRQCQLELRRLQRWMLSPGGLALQTLRAYDGAAGNFIDYSEVSSPSGVQFSDVFGVVLAIVPGVGPIARWVGREAIRAATVAAAQAAMNAAVQRGTAMGREAGTAAGQQGRADFASQVRAESAELADTLARNVDDVLTAYENGVEAAHRAGNADALRTLLVSMQHANDEARSVAPAQYNELSRRFEIELYRRHYSSSASLVETRHLPFLLSDPSPPIVTYRLQGIPQPVIGRLIGRGGLGVATSREALGRLWSLRLVTVERRLGSME